MKEIVWVIGHSGSGKATFCNSLRDNPSPFLVDQLGWRGLRLGLIESSVDLVSRGKTDRTHMKRDKILGELEVRAGEIDVAIIKYQAVDFDTGRLDRIKSRFPGVKVRALVVEAGVDEIKKRLYRRQENNKWDSVDSWDEFFKIEREHINKVLKRFVRVGYINTNDEVYNLRT